VVVQRAGGRVPPRHADARPAERWDVVRITFYVTALPRPLLVFDLADGTSRSVYATYNGHPKPGTYLGVVGAGGGLQPTTDMGGERDEHGHVIGWVTPPGIGLAFDGSVALTVRTGDPTVDALGGDVSHAAGDGGGAAGGSVDRLYFRPESGFSFGDPGRADSRLVGRHIVDWAKARGGARAHTSETIKKLQVAPTSEDQIVDEIHLDLLKRIREGTTVDPDTAAAEPDDFEGGPRARDGAVLDLERRWEVVRRWLRTTMTSYFHHELEQALVRAPERSRLILDPATLTKARTQPNPGALVINKTWGATIKVGDPVGAKVLRDFDSIDSATANVYFTLAGHDDWLYRAFKSQWLDNDRAWTTKTISEVHEATKLAGLLWPMMVKWGGFGVQMAGGWAGSVVGAALYELGEEGELEQEGHGRSAAEILEAIGTDILVDRIFHFATQTVPKALYRSYTARLSKLEAKGAQLTTEAGVKEWEAYAANELRTAVETTEGTLVERELRAGRGRVVGQEGGRDLHQVDIEIEGHRHTYVENADGTWCRYSATGMCDLNLGDDVRAAESGAADVAHQSKTVGVGRKVAVSKPKLLAQYEALANKKLPDIIEDVKARELSTADRSRLTRLKARFENLRDAVNHRNARVLTFGERSQAMAILDEARDIARRDFGGLQSKVMKRLAKDPELQAVEDKLIAAGDATRGTTNAGEASTGALRIKTVRADGSVSYEPLNIEHRTRLSDDPWSAKDADNLIVTDAAQNQEYLEKLRALGFVWPTDETEDFIVRFGLNRQDKTFAPAGRQ
jgi:hypothetical protein